MITALDNNGQRVYADTVDRGTPCFCQVCGEPMRLKRGTRRMAHFSHLPESQCSYAAEKGEWHIRMQNYFPKETQEKVFRDENTKEIHVADVFLEESNTVLEFQHSRISLEEYMKRTIFHTSNKRRIVWLFDESSSSKNRTYGRFKAEDDWYHWIGTPRDFLRYTNIDLMKSYGCYSIFVYTGTEGDAFRRIVDERAGYYDVMLSDKLVKMEQDMDVDQFFECDEYWIRRHQARVQASQQQRSYGTIKINVLKPRKGHF